MNDSATAAAGPMYKDDASVQLNAKDPKSFERVAALIADNGQESACANALFVHNQPADFLNNILRKLLGRCISAVPTTFRDASRVESFDDFEMVIICYDIGGHNDVDAVIANCKAKGAKYFTVQRKSATWPPEMVGPGYKVAAKVIEKTCDKLDEKIVELKASGDGAALMATLTDGVKEFTMAAIALRYQKQVHDVERDRDRLRCELEESREKLNKSRNDDVTAHEMLAESEREIAVLKGTLAKLEEHSDAQRRALDDLSIEKADLQMRLEAARAERAEIRIPPDAGRLEKIITAAAAAVDAGLLDAKEAFERILRSTMRPL